MSIKSRPPIVEVVWKDAVTSAIGDSMSIKAAKEYPLAVRASTGYHLLTNKERVVICAVWDQEADDDSPTVSEVTVIPHSWIIEIVTVKKARIIKPKPKKV